MAQSKVPGRLRKNSLTSAVSPNPANTGSPSLTTIPAELRLRIYTLLLTAATVKVEPQFPDQQDSDSTWCMRPLPGLFSPQLLRVCRLFHSEAALLLYTHNTFDCRARDALPLLQTTIPAHIHFVRHLILDWEQLQDFAWSLARPHWHAATAGLEQITLATWRKRVLDSRAYPLLDICSYESTIVQAAIEICEKHERLAKVLQRAFVREGRWPRFAGKSGTGWVKWRFVSESVACGEGETEVALEDDRALLMSRGDGWRA